MKLIIYCDACGVLIPLAAKRGECCSECREGNQRRAQKTTDECSFRRPNVARILATIRREVRIPASHAV